MKTIRLLIILLLFTGFLNAQENFSVPQVTNDQKIEILYSHVIAYAVTGISFAKSQGVSAEAYGKFMGEKFTDFWDPSTGFPLLVNQLMFILAGMHPDNQMQIVNQDEKSITVKMKNVDISFQNGPMFDVTYQDFLDCSYGIISVLAEFMHSGFSHKMTDDGWYEFTLNAK